MHFGLEQYVPLALYVGAVAAFLLSLFWRPQAGLYFLVPLLPLQTIRYRILDFPLGNKLIDMLLLGVVLGAVFKGGFRFAKTPDEQVSHRLWRVLLHAALAWRILSKLGDASLHQRSAFFQLEKLHGHVHYFCGHGERDQRCEADQNYCRAHVPFRTGREQRLLRHHE